MYYLAENNWEEAELIMNPHYSSLKDRPEWDGYYTLSEAIEWYSHLIKGDDDNYKSHRLTNIEIDGNESHNIIYDNLGNISFKYDAGSMIYNSTNPYAVRMITDVSDITSFGGSQDVTYTSFDKVKSISQDNKNLHISYGADHQRVRQTLNVGEVSKTKRYFTPRYETISTGGTTKKIHYLTSSTGLFAIFALESNNSGTMSYVIKDHQGSLNATVTGGAVSHYGFDAWGRRRDPQTLSYDNVSTSIDRGYTLHEHYDEFGLINMNGRLYDPLVGRMLSPDIVIQDEQNSQAYNRYSYCFNNPLRFTDPSGYVVKNPPYYFMLMNPNKIILKYYFGVEPSTVEYNTDESEGTKRISVKWMYDGNIYEADWVHQNLDGYYQTDKYGCLATCMVAQERRFPYGNIDITEESLLSIFPDNKGIPAYKGWIEFEKITNVYHNWNENSNNDITALEDPFGPEFNERYGDVIQYSFDAMNKGEGVTYHYFTDDPNMNHAINAYEAVRYFDGSKNNTTYDIKMWDPDPRTGGRKPFTKYRLNKIHTLKLKLH